MTPGGRTDCLSSRRATPASPRCSPPPRCARTRPSARSTGGSAMVLIVSGPIAGQLAINGGHNAFGQGHRPNATIGRAVRLIMMNVMNTRPGVLDRAVFGNPGKYSFCFAENEDEHPWEPLHVERGLRPEQSAVTVYASNSL